MRFVLFVFIYFSVTIAYSTLNFLDLPYLMDNVAAWNEILDVVDFVTSFVFNAVAISGSGSWLLIVFSRAFCEFHKVSMAKNLVAPCPRTHRLLAATFCCMLLGSLSLKIGDYLMLSSTSSLVDHSITQNLVMLFLLPWLSWLACFATNIVSQLLSSAWIAHVRTQCLTVARAGDITRAAAICLDNYQQLDSILGLYLLLLFSAAQVPKNVSVQSL